MNNFGNDGLIALVEGLKANDKIEDLQLSYNKISGHGTKFLAEWLKINQSLIRLNLHSNELQDEGKNTILKFQPNFSSQLFFLPKQKGVIELAQALLKNRTLKLLDVADNYFGTPGASSLLESLSKNKMIK